jgi:hypothetical protein
MPGGLTLGQPVGWLWQAPYLLEQQTAGGRRFSGCVVAADDGKPSI